MNETGQIGKNYVRRNDDEQLSGEEDWSDSSYSSYYTDSDSSIPDWDSSVDERTGEVLYIECHPFVTHNIKDDKNEKEKCFSRKQTRRSTRGKFLRLLRRRDSKRYSKQNIKMSESELHNTNKVKFQDFQEGEEREVLLKVKNEATQRGHNFLIEPLLGINISTLSDGIRLMVAGFLPDSDAKYEKNIKIGDWLKSIDGIEVNFQNINAVFQQLSSKNEVLVKLQRVAGMDVTKDPPINVLNSQSSFVRKLTSFNSEEDEQFQELLCKFPLGVLYLDTDALDEMAPEYQDVIYCYPKPMQKNKLCNAKGIFLTLNHLLQDITKSPTKLTSLSFNNVLCHVAYLKFEKKLLLLMLPDNYAKPVEIESIVKEICRMLEFTYNTLDVFFMDNAQKADHTFSMFFAKVLNGGVWTGKLKIPEDISSIPPNDYVFEDLLLAIPTIELPNEAMIQIEDAMTELEACDYREWNEEPLDCQRIFTMLGSALFHSGYLLASHLIPDDLVDVNCFCKYQGILHLSKTEPLKTLIVWKEVFPTSCRSLNVPIFKLPDARRYLLIVGTGKDLLIVIMEAGGSTEPPEENAAPDPFYVEEAQATLAHLQELGIPELAGRFLELNIGHQPIPSTTSNKKKIDVSNLAKSPQGQSRDSLALNKKQEVTSILKRRNNDHAQTVYTSTYASVEDTYDVRSEDSESQGCGSEKSELSDDPIMGKKAENINIYESDNEESENGVDGSQMSNNSFDISEIKQMLLTETADVQPIQIATGAANVLYHYVQFDALEGILISPPEYKVESRTQKIVISSFRKCCQQIHGLFQNTIRFKDMSSQDMAKSVMNKSLIAIKEYGTMFECPFLDEKESKKNKISFWVIGRLFFSPHVREVYVCYNDAIPQNLIELAFKMNMGFCDS
ncbi:hypothetical protein HHI36_016904 [Cryptolaemus montrouzieri]|uniref:Protein inturned n=1 Tax=Cryptolaemus montrouzieri TaxID=559131 RepID=A0ABD2NLI4_9CUCU